MRLLWAILFSTTILSAKITPPFKVYDCFLFFNELEILDIRLHELYDAVDYFVLVESAETFRGHPKPYYFEENKERYRQFLDKIIHVKVNEHFETDTPWFREHFQRNQILRGLSSCRDDDIVFICDADEICRATSIPNIIKPLPMRHANTVSFELFWYLGFLNRPVGPMYGPVATTYRFLKQHLPQGVRDLRNDPSSYRVLGAGWHFCYAGGPEVNIKKLRAYCHGHDEPLTHEEVERWWEGGPFVPIDESFPQYVRERQEYLVQLGYIGLP